MSTSTTASSGALPWVWAAPPTDTLRGLVAELEAGRLPEPREVLKDNRRRTVWSLPDLEGGLILKHYRARSRDVVKAIALAGRAEAEYRAMEAFCRVGLPTVRPVAYADRKRGLRLQEAWFLARLVPGARTVREALDEEPDEAARLALVKASLAVIVELHAHPYFHRDLHAGNLLLDQAGQVLIIDLHSVWRMPWLTRGMRLENLARFLFSLREIVSLDEAPALVADYARLRGESVERLVLDTRRALQAFERNHVRSRSVRCMLDTTEFVRGGSSLGRVFRRREYSLETLEDDLRAHARAEEQGGLLHGSRRSHLSLSGDGARVVKDYVDRGAWRALRGRLGRGRARTAWRAARRCEVVGVPTPRALALLERRDGSAALVTEACRDAPTLEELAERAAGLDPRRRGALAFAVGHLVGRLWRAGLLHDDMSPKNLLVTEGEARPTRDLRTMPPPGLVDVQVVDLDNMRRVEPFAWRSLARMLGQLADVPTRLSRGDRRRFALGVAASAGRALPPAAVSRARRLLAERVAAREARLAASGGDR